MANGFGCKANLYAEIKELAGGAGSVTGSYLGRSTAERACAVGLIRNLDHPSAFQNDLPEAACPGQPSTVQAVVANEVFPLEIPHDRVDWYRCRLSNGSLPALLVHLSEGNPPDASARRELPMLKARGLLTPGVVIVHGAAFGLDEFRSMSQAGVGLVWSPRSRTVHAYASDIRRNRARRSSVPSIVFTTRLTEADWDDTLRGWRCPPLAVPGAIVEALYVEGNRIDSARYEVLQERSLIRWTPSDQPQRVAATIRLTEDLTLGTETDRWKKLAIILPVVATVVSAVISGGTTYLSKAAPEVRPPSRSAATPIISPVSPAPAPRDGASAEATDNTHISRARTLAFGQVGTGIATQLSQHWFRFVVDGIAPKLVHVVVRNPAFAGGLSVRVLNAFEAQLKSHDEYQSNVVVDLPSLLPGVYYVAVGPLISASVSFEVVVMAE